MFTRTTGFLIVPLWLAAMAWLVAHDVWPRWTAEDPPALKATNWLRGEGAKEQYTINDQLGPLGTIWTSYLIDESTILRNDFVWIERFPIALTAARLTADWTFTSDGLLDEFKVRLETAGQMFRLRGERFDHDFSFAFESGPISRAFKIPLTDGGIIVGAFNPFAQLSGVRVGQRWRMQVFNPIAALTGIGDRFIPMLVRVTGEERITTADGDHNCLVVESAHARAWVDARGVVQVQEMTLPVIGPLRMVRQPHYDAAARDRAWRAQIVDARATAP